MDEHGNPSEAWFFYQLMDKESTGRIEVTSSLMRKPPEEYVFCRKLLAHGGRSLIIKDY
jgi:hypothetical protein